MKVAFVCDWYLPRLGGLELHLRDLAGALARAGHDIHLVTSTRADPDRQAWRLPTASLPDPEGVTVHRLRSPVLPVYKLAFTPWTLGEMQELFRREAYDLVHSHVSVVAPTALGGAWVAHRMGVPGAVTFHSHLRGFRPVLRLLDRVAGWTGWGLGLSAVSAPVAADVEGLGTGPVTVVPNAVDPGWWRVQPDPRRDEGLRLISVMRLNFRKRGGALLSVVAEAARELEGEREVSLTLIGDGPERRALERRARRLRIEEKVSFEGYRSREAIREGFRRADAFVLPTVLEAFGLSALEARTAGLPVLARRSPGVAEFVGHRREGLLAESDAALARAVVEIARDDELRRRIARHNRETSHPFTWPRAVAATERLWAEARRDLSGTPSDPGGVRARA